MCENGPPTEGRARKAVHMSSDAVTTVSVEIAGTEISFETGKMAKQASGAVVVRQGETMVLTTATVGNLRDVDFLPLTVDGEEGSEGYALRRAAVQLAFDKLEKTIIRERIAVHKKRPDGRAEKEIRPISIEVGVAPRTHGSALFTRGQTQALSVASLGTLKEEMRLDTLGLETQKFYWHHYNFPPFSVGEAGFMRGPKRRDIGHGALAERALAPMVPSIEDFPYTIRVVSDILESNGSSSMASVSGSSLSLMDAGVPIRKPVAGIAMGLIKEGDDYIILTDLAGVEDHLGDMDFKVAGTQDGIT